MAEISYTAMIAGLAYGSLMAVFCLYTMLIAKYRLDDPVGDYGKSEFSV
jgi:hypothetical protein